MGKKRQETELMGILVNYFELIGFGKIELDWMWLTDFMRKKRKSMCSETKKN